MKKLYRLHTLFSGYDVFVMTTALFPSRILRPAIVLLLLTIPALAKDAPLQVIDWPATGTPAVRFTFDKFKQLQGMGNMHAYVMDTTAQNLSPKLIPNARFSVYLFDKNKVRIGEDVIALKNLGAGETVKFETTVTTSGAPVSVTLENMTEAVKAVSLTVNSTPQGATLQLDGTEQGTTPRIIKVGAGKHTLTFAKEGFIAGNFPLEITADDVSGGTVSYELGAAAFDSIELRDGSVLNGDLISIAGMDVEIRVGGAIQHLDRNKIKRVMLTQRDVPAPTPPPAASTDPR
jgi:hypothetical protein